MAMAFRNRTRILTVVIFANLLLAYFCLNRSVIDFFVKMENSSTLQLYRPDKFQLEMLAQIECLLTRTMPKYNICIHNISQDIVSNYLKNSGNWEMHIINALKGLIHTWHGIYSFNQNGVMYSLHCIAKHCNSPPPPRA